MIFAGGTGRCPLWPPAAGSQQVVQDAASDAIASWKLNGIYSQRYGGATPFLPDASACPLDIAPGIRTPGRRSSAG